MSIASQKPCSSDLDTHDDDQLLKPTCYDTITCNSREGDLPDLEDITEGPVWTLDDYFQQQLRKDSTLHYQDPNQSPVYQQYDRIKNYTVNVIEPLSTTIDPDTNVATVTGSSLFSKWFSPNVGDQFIVSLQDGKYIFRVTSVVAKTYRANPKYEVSYLLVERFDPISTTYNDLINKTDHTLVFDSGLASGGVNPLVDQAAQTERVSLLPYMIAAGDDYFKRFTDQRTGLLLTQIDGKSVYDPFLVDYMRSTISLLGNQFRREIRAVAINKRKHTKYNIFDFMMHRRLLLTEAMCDKFCIVSRRHFLTHRDLSNFSQTLVDYMVSAIDTSSVSGLRVERGACPDRNVPDDECLALTDVCGSCGPSDTDDLHTDYTRMVSVDGQSVRTIKSPAHDTYYVFSTDFYTESANQSLLESLVRKYLNNDNIPISTLVLLWDDYKNWCDLSRFYYTGILIQLSDYALKGHRCP